VAVVSRIGDVAVAQQPTPDMGAERVVMVDDTAVLISVAGDDGTETAFWSRDTGFAGMLSSLLEEFVADVADEQ
jgi:hypothetical protein